MRNKPVRRYMRDALPPLMLTLVLAALMAYFGRSLESWGAPGKILFLVVLMLCYGWCGWIEFRHLRQCDELRRRLVLEAMMQAFIAATGIFMVLFFAHALKLLTVSMNVAPLVMVGCYVVCEIGARLRYRYWALL